LNQNLLHGLKVIKPYSAALHSGLATAAATTASTATFAAAFAAAMTATFAAAFAAAMAAAFTAAFVFTTFAAGATTAPCAAIYVLQFRASQITHDALLNK
jgi:hypothetical protein